MTRNYSALERNEGLPWWYSGWESACRCKGTWVWSLIGEDSTCLGATKPMCPNYWAHELQLLKPVLLEPVLRSEKPPQWEMRTAAKSSPCPPQLQKPELSTKTQHSPTNKKGMKFSYMLHHGWTWKSCWVKEARHKRASIGDSTWSEVPRLGKLIDVACGMMVARVWREGGEWGVILPLKFFFGVDHF